MAQPNTTRRALIGGAGIATVAAAIPAVASIAPAAGSSLFGKRLAAFQQANGLFEREANKPGVSDERANYLCERAGDAFRALKGTPAPDAKAIAHKLKALADWADGTDIPSEYIEALGREASAILTNTGKA